MTTVRCALAITLMACAGCAFIPRESLRLDEARQAYAEAQRDPTIAGFAAAELQAAGELLDRASHARDTLDDPAMVDHLCYLARQRVAIAREAARIRSFEHARRAL